MPDGNSEYNNALDLEEYNEWRSLYIPDENYYTIYEFNRRKYKLN